MAWELNLRREFLLRLNLHNSLAEAHSFLLPDTQLNQLISRVGDIINLIARTCDLSRAFQFASV